MTTDLLASDVLISASQMFDEMPLEKAEILAPRGMTDKKDGEKVLGEISSNLTKRLFALTFYCRVRYRELLMSSETELDSEKAAQSVAEGHRLGEYADLFKALLFVNIQHELNTWDKPIGVRKGWLIVEQAAAPGLGPEFMRRMMGGEE